MVKTADLTESRRTLSSSLAPGQYHPPSLLCTTRLMEASFDRLGQATWITCVSLPALLVNIIPRAAQPALGLRDLLAVGIWAGGIGFEIIADRGGSILSLC